MKEVTWSSGGLVFFIVKKYGSRKPSWSSPFVALDTYYGRDREREQERERERNFLFLLLSFSFFAIVAS